MKYRLWETRQFVAGNLEGLVIDHNSFTFDEADKEEAYDSAEHRPGCRGGGNGYGSPYIVKKAWIEVIS